MWLRPALPGRALPARESVAWRYSVRLIAIVGLEFLPDQDAMRGRLALGLLATRLTPVHVVSGDADPTEPPLIDVAAA